jgi:hypothetical protein
VRYITALSYYTDTVALDLTLHPVEGWVIEPDRVDLQVPPDQFLRQPSVDWLAQGRRRVDTQSTDPRDVMDRPAIEVLSAQLVRDEQDRFSIVGELRNTDVNPADVTVTGLIYDDNGDLLTWYNATDKMMHKLLPWQITPYRIDFEGVAGLELEDAAKSLSFSPDATWPYRLDDGMGIGSFEVFAKAVVTYRDLGQNLGLQELNVRTVDGQLILDGVLINSGLEEAIVPHLLITLYDDQGQALWVDHMYIRESVRPQRTQTFSTPLKPLAELDHLALPYAVSPGGNDTPAIHHDMIRLPDGHGYSFLSVREHYFTGQ